MKTIRKIFIAAITLILSTIILGFGLVVNNKTKYAIGLVCIAYSALLLICWSNLIETPVALFSFFAFIVLLQLGSAVWSTYISVSEKKREYSKIKAWIKAAVFGAVTIPLLATVFLNKSEWLGYDVFYIPSQSMQPTLKPGDYILVNTWYYSIDKPKLGEVILFNHPQKSKMVMIKRITGVPGNKIFFDFIRYYLTSNKNNSKNIISVTLKENQFFVTGDNYKQSIDSRFWGPLEKDNIIGKAIFIWFSLSSQKNISFNYDRIGTRI